MLRLLKGTRGESAGFVPVAMMTFGGFIVRLILRAHHVNVRGVGEAGQAGEHFDAVARELRANHVDFGFDHVLRAEGKIGHRDLFLHA